MTLVSRSAGSSSKDLAEVTPSPIERAASSEPAVGSPSKTYGPIAPSSRSGTKSVRSTVSQRSPSSFDTASTLVFVTFKCCRSPAACSDRGSPGTRLRGRHSSSSLSQTCRSSTFSPHPRFDTRPARTGRVTGRHLDLGRRPQPRDSRKQRLAFASNLPIWNASSTMPTTAARRDAYVSKIAEFKGILARSVDRPRSRSPDCAPLSGSPGAGRPPADACGRSKRPRW